ncbi:MAG: hypothetical protein R6X02_11640 [Enhygromyxa sp.]
MLVIVLRRDLVARMLDVAPDLYSVHRARFRFARLVRPRPVPDWLLTDWEFAAVVVDDGQSFADRVDRFSALLSSPEGRRHWLLGCNNARLASRLITRFEGLRPIVHPRPVDLASALESPSVDTAELLRDSLRTARASASSYLAHLCAAALMWMHLQRSELEQSRAILDELSLHGRGAGPFSLVRVELLQLHQDAAEAAAPISISSTLDELIRSLYAYSVGISSLLSCAEILWESQASIGAFRLAMERLDSWESSQWRFDQQIRALPAELIEAAMTKQQRADAIAWLRERRTQDDRNWGGVWTMHLMLERAVGHASNVAALQDLAQEWLDTPRHRIYPVWRPLVDVLAEDRDSAALGDLVRMPLDPGGVACFGSELATALLVVADVVDRGLVELSTTERGRLRSLAAAGEALPLDMRLGLEAIKHALARR